MIVSVWFSFWIWILLNVAGFKCNLLYLIGFLVIAELLRFGVKNSLK